MIDDTVLLPTGMNTGTRAIRISKTDGQLVATELWTSRNLKPDFTDCVSHQGHLYGIDGGIFTCVDLKTGDRKWKGGRFGKGQVLLLENSGLLLVAAESGRVVLLQADPGAHVEVGAFKALEGETWNHPVVVHDRLYVRNLQEAACFQLLLAESSVLRKGGGGGPPVLGWVESGLTAEDAGIAEFRRGNRMQCPSTSRRIAAHSFSAPLRLCGSIPRGTRENPR